MDSCAFVDFCFGEMSFLGMIGGFWYDPVSRTAENLASSSSSKAILVLVSLFSSSFTTLSAASIYSLVKEDISTFSVVYKSSFHVDLTPNFLAFSLN